MTAVEIAIINLNVPPPPEIVYDDGVYVFHRIQGDAVVYRWDRGRDAR